MHQCMYSACNRYVVSDTKYGHVMSRVRLCDHMLRNALRGLQPSHELLMGWRACPQHRYDVVGVTQPFFHCVSLRWRRTVPLCPRIANCCELQFAIRNSRTQCEACTHSTHTPEVKGWWCHCPHTLGCERYCLEGWGVLKGLTSARVDVLGRRNSQFRLRELRRDRGR